MMYATPVVALILLHTLDGREVTVNARQITSMHHAKPNSSNKLLTDSANCVIGLTDSKFISVEESCDSVKRMIEGAK